MRYPFERRAAKAAAVRNGALSVCRDLSSAVQPYKQRLFVSCEPSWQRQHSWRGMGDVASKQVETACNCCGSRGQEFQGTSMQGVSQSLRGSDTGSCIICKQAGANTICLPCGHLLVCFRCSLRYGDGAAVRSDIRCPTCKQPVQSFQRVFTQSTASR